jgi:polysaccharide export outer membrane protein
MEGHLQIIRAIALAVPLLLYVIASFSIVSAQSDAGEILDAGDRLTVTVFGQPEMSGVFLIDGDGNVELPIVGAVPVGQLTIRNAQKRVEDRLSDGYILHPSVSIVITERRPIYVVGDVKAPGTFPFRNGSTVLNAVAQAGGYGSQAPPVVGAALADYLLSDERVATLESTKLTLSVRKARLEAQVDGRDSFDPPLLADADFEQVEAAVANERETLQRQRQSLKAQMDLLHSQRPRLQNAIAAVEKQIDSEKRQQELVQVQLSDWAKMKEKGLALRATEVALLREQAAIEITMSGIRTELARLSVTMGDLDIKIHEVEAADRQRVSNELQEVRTRLGELATMLPSARRVRDVRLQQSENGVSSDSLRPTHRVIIRRMSKTGVKTVQANDETLLEPGDIVEVMWLSPDSDVTVYRRPMTRKQAQLEGYITPGTE